MSAPASAASSAVPLLEVRGLRTELRLDTGPVDAVADISFALERGRTLGLVGESGCGKSLTALSLLRLLPEAARIAGGRIAFEGRDLVSLSEEEMRRIRGNKISMVFQEPMTALNPVFTVGRQIGEAVELHQHASRREAHARAIQLLREVGIPAPEQRVDAYPHQLSGGMRQRVMIAMALACNPALLIADEPTTALDVTIQAQILELLRRLQEERGMALLLITHDLGVVAETCDDVAVMYAGRIVESAPVETLFARPAHPYTAGLLRSLPDLRLEDTGARRRLQSIPGQVPSLRSAKVGCRFRERCDRALELCARIDPPLTAPRDGVLAACHNPVPAP